MDIKGEYQIASDRDAVWAALNDPRMLQKCIPGCESLERSGDDEYRGKVAAAIGPVRARFDIVIRLENARPPESYTLSGESRAGAAGFGRGSADVVLAERDGGTHLSYRADFKVGGKLAQVGSRLVLGATRKTADDFFGCLSRELVPEKPAAAAEAADASLPAPSARTSHMPLAIALAALGLLLLWFLLR